MSRRMAIYGLVDPRTGMLRYIGQSVNYLKRWNGHRRPPSKCDRSHRASWIRHLQANGLQPICVLIELCDSVEQLNSREEYWIAYYQAAGVPLTNHTPGGANHSRDETTRQKLSTALKGRKLSAEVRANISAGGKGHVVTQETRAKQSAAAKGKTLSVEHRAKLSAAARGRPLAGAACGHTPETRAKISAARKAYWKKVAEIEGR